MEIELVDYSGEFYFKATLDMAIYKEIGQLLLRCELKKGVSAKIVWPNFI